MAEPRLGKEASVLGDAPGLGHGGSRQMRADTTHKAALNSAMTRRRSPPCRLD